MDLLSDKEITRQVTLQNQAVIDYLLLLHPHRCKEFEGLCCFNLSSKAEDVHHAIDKIKNMVSDIQREREDWLGGLFQNWGLSAWVGSILKTCLLILFIIILCIDFGLIKCMLVKLISSITSPPEVNMASVPSAPTEDMGDPEDIVLPKGDDATLPFEEWPTNQDWFGTYTQNQNT